MLSEEGWSVSRTAAGFATAETAGPGCCRARRVEFEAGRRAVKRAGEMLEVDLSQILRGDSGAPTWPVGVTGSITHCRGYAAAIAARTHVVATVGVDAEPWTPVDRDTLRYITTEREWPHVLELEQRQPDVPWCRILFTVKEATFKALSFLNEPVTFSQACVTFSGQAVSVWCETPATQRLLSGRWVRRPESDTILTAVWVAAPDRDPTTTDLSQR